MISPNIGCTIALILIVLILIIALCANSGQLSRLEEKRKQEGGE